MEEQLVSFEIALLAKKKGFQIPTNEYSNIVEPKKVITVGAFNHNYIPHGNVTVSLPRQSLLQKWLRKNHDLHIEVSCNGYDIHHKHYSFRSNVRKIIKTELSKRHDGVNQVGGYIFMTYESALEGVLKIALMSLETI